MSVILLESFHLEQSSFRLLFGTNGQRLSEEEAKRLGLINGNTVEEHQLRYGWSPAWFDVKPGNKIVAIQSGQKIGDPDRVQNFVVPRSGFADPPQKLDAGGVDVLYYLERFAKPHQP